MTARRTRIIPVDPETPDAAALREAAAVLDRGGLVAFPTETVYGLGADATNPEAVAAIFAAKGRPAFNPLIVHADGLAMARSCVIADEEWMRRLAGPWWPGPLTLVLPRSTIIPDIVTAGKETVGVRVPKPPIARGLIAALGRPIAAPSANRSMGVSPTRAEHVLDDLDGRIDLILDGGPSELGLESTVVDATTVNPRVLRPGPITARALALSSGLVIADAVLQESHTEHRSPGMLATHYAPRTPAFWIEIESTAEIPADPRRALLIVGHPEMGAIAGPDLRRSLATPEETARELYALLREWDTLKLDAILVVPPPDLPEWRAVRDRLRRATTQLE